ncbi:MAG: isocitrate lyase/phosphoenolpyruvate mutase family protein [Acidimicrobiales bacterium]
MHEMTGMAGRFLALHDDHRPLLQPNAWDAGSARVLEAMGFEAIATTSSGFAATLGRVDYEVSRDEALEHARAVAAAVGVPVAADTENGFADEPEGVAETVRLAAATGVAGCSIEDYTGHDDAPIHDAALATERVAAAAEAAHSGPDQLVLTARAENHLHGRGDLADTIARLQAFQEAGADVLFAPGVIDPDDLRVLVGSVDRPVNVLALPGCPPVEVLGELGVARLSVGGAFAHVALGGLVAAATELREAGTFHYWTQVGAALPTIRRALDPRS